ncbi:MAG: hypothetical protein P8X89_06565 [Reinekea sp.]|jgi:hypothetical protein
MKQILLLFIMVLITAACSSLPPQTDAIHEALTTNIALRSATRQCADLGGEMRDQAEIGYSDWWWRNQKLVQAADYGLLQLNWETSQKVTEEQHAVLGIQLLEMLVVDSTKQVSDWLGSQVRNRDCQKLFTQVEEGRLDLDRSRSIAKTLNELSQQRESVAEDAERARSINARYRKYGRSMTLAEKLLRESGCRTSKLSLLRNSWPLEVYDTVCGQDDYVLVKCLWGRCEIKR